MKTIRLKAGTVSLKAQLNDSETAQKIWQALPFEGTTNRWGNEIYFSIPVAMELEDDARAEVAVGELGYWPVGHAFCIFWGSTPASHDDQPRAASQVNIFGRILGDATKLESVPDGMTIHIDTE